MAGQKFGASDAPELTWVMNTLVPAIVAERYAGSRIVVFSTGCVYPLAPVDGPGLSRGGCPGAAGRLREFLRRARAGVRVFRPKSLGTQTLMYRLELCHRLALRRAHGCRAKGGRGAAGGRDRGLRQRDLAGRRQCPRHSVPESCRVTASHIETSRAWSVCPFGLWRCVLANCWAARPSSPVRKAPPRGSSTPPVLMTGLDRPPSRWMK